MLTSKIAEGIFDVINEMMHRTNSAVIITSQMFYLRNAKPLRDNCKYLIVFPGQNDLTKFFSGYSKENFTQIINSLSEQKDDEWDVGNGTDGSKPVIIEKEPGRQANEIKVWRNIYDVSPSTLSILPRGNSSSTESTVRRLASKR